MKRFLVRIYIKIIYLWGSIWFDNSYFKGKYFLKDYYSFGWKMILKCWFPQKILGYGRGIPFPVSNQFHLNCPENVFFDMDDFQCFFSPGCYIQAMNAKVYIGKGTKIAPNVGIITTNHDFNDLDKHLEGKDVVIGNNCWIGMNSVILPGVKLGDKTIVGAGSIVTKSFKEGNCVIAGNPAKIIRRL